MVVGRLGDSTGVDRIVRLAGQFFDVPICAVGGTPLKRIWTKSDQQICLHQIEEIAAAWANAIPGRDPLIVPDTSADERFASLPETSTPPGIRFYAGMPLIACGVRMGTLALLDTRPHAPFDAGQISALQDFAVLARQEMERSGATTRDWLILAQQAAEIGFWDWDVINDTSTCSDQFFRLYGIEPRTPFSYQDWQRLLHPDDRRTDPMLGNPAINQQDAYESELRCIWPDGSIHWLLSKAKIYRNESGRPVRVIGANIDMTRLREEEERRKQAERELLASREQLRQLAARLESAREQERIRIAREIHDELGQMLSVLKMDLSAIEARYRSSSSRSLKEVTVSLAAMLKSLDSIMASLRRISSELRPGVLDHLGIAAAIEWQVREFRSRTGIICRTSGLQEHLPLNDEQSTVVFRIFQEILNNINRHAKATAVKVEVRLRSGRLTLRVADNGRGFVREQMSDPDALGLLGMRERALLLGGVIELDSGLGKGTAVTLQIPVAVGELASERAHK